MPFCLTTLYLVPTWFGVNVILPGDALAGPYMGRWKCQSASASVEVRSFWPLSGCGFADRRYVTEFYTGNLGVEKHFVGMFYTGNPGVPRIRV